MDISFLKKIVPACIIFLIAACTSSSATDDTHGQGAEYADQACRWSFECGGVQDGYVCQTEKVHAPGQWTCIQPVDNKGSIVSKELDLTKVDVASNNVVQSSDRSALLGRLTEVYAAHVRLQVAQWVSDTQNLRNSADYIALSEKFATWQEDIEGNAAFVKVVDDLFTYVIAGQNSVTFAGTQSLVQCARQLSASWSARKALDPKMVDLCLNNYDKVLNAWPSPSGLSDDERFAPVTALREGVQLWRDELANGFTTSTESNFVVAARLAELGSAFDAYASIAYLSAKKVAERFYPLIRIPTTTLGWVTGMGSYDGWQAGQVAKAIRSGEIAIPAANRDLDTNYQNWKSVVDTSYETVSDYIQKLTAKIPRSLRDACPLTDEIEQDPAACASLNTPVNPFWELSETPFTESDLGTLVKIGVLSSAVFEHPEFRDLVDNIISQETTKDFMIDTAGAALALTCAWSKRAAVASLLAEASGVGAPVGATGQALGTIACAGAWTMALLFGAHENQYLSDAAMTYFYGGVGEAFADESVVRDKYRWAFVDYAAVGVTAFGFVPFLRGKTIESTKKWIEKVHDSRKLMAFVRLLTPVGDIGTDVGFLAAFGHLPSTTQVLAVIPSLVSIPTGINAPSRCKTK